MKKGIVLIMVVVLFVAVLAGCGGNLSKPKNGTYRSEGLITQTWTFSGNNNITLSAAGGLVATTGTYTIDGTRMLVTSSLFGVETTSSYTITEITSKSFFIDGTKFTKQ